MVEDLKLIEAALKAKEKAYAPYSNFRVGAALLSTSGRIYSGCNVENSSYGLTICAERVALVSAVAAGETNFKTMAIVSDSPNFTAPCGACRQVMWEFSRNLRILLVNKKKRKKVLKISDLLPLPFK